jgi:RHS repeat-associated protein
VLSGAETAFRVSIDANGNLTGDGTKTYEWDAENQLTAVKQGGNTLASFTYDGNGRRATKTAGGVTTTYVYYGAQFLEERPSTGTTKRYVYGLGIDRPLAQAVGGVTSYSVADHLGSVVRTTDASGAPTLTREYDPWGNLLQGSTMSGYAFTGREWEPDIGLYYYRARYYNAAIGRFTSEDPIGLEGGTNLFAYVQNRPLTHVDPEGTGASIPELTRDAPSPRLGEIQSATFLVAENDSRCIYGAVAYEEFGLGLAYVTKCRIGQLCGKVCRNCPSPGYGIQVFLRLRGPLKFVFITRVNVNCSGVS